MALHAARSVIAPMEVFDVIGDVVTLDAIERVNARGMHEGEVIAQVTLVRLDACRGKPPLDGKTGEILVKDVSVRTDLLL